MKLEEILNDLSSDRVKKVIMDCDAYNDIDDQYAIAFAAGSNKIDLLSVNATLFNNYRCNGFADGMQRSYDEIVKVLKLMGCENTVKAYVGCDTPLTKVPENTWVDSPAVQNIIKAAHESDELVYVVATGAATNVSCAIMADPSIMDNICVVWVACNCINHNGTAGEFNVDQDSVAAKYLINCGVNLVLLPAMGPEGFGTQMLIGNQPFLDGIVKGDSVQAKFFRDDLPELAYPGEHDWTHHFWDVAGPGVIHDASAYELSVIMAPRIRGDGVWAFDEGRHNIIYMSKLNADKVMRDTFESICKLI